MTTYLLDANVLIALTISEHEHHDRVSRWLSGADASIALCPVVEGALVRFLVRIGESAKGAVEVLRLMHADPRCEFWPDSLSYVSADLSHVRGHRQVTDAYLVALVLSRPDVRLATMDRGLSQARPEATFCLPGG